MRHKLVLYCAVAIGLILFLCITDLTALYFLNDDNIYIPASKNLNFLYGTSFRPISDLSLLLDYSLWHNKAGGYHITNFILHIITSVIVFFLADIVFKKYNSTGKNQYKALAVAALFFFYPFHSEAIFWIIGRGSILGALFGVSSIAMYINRERNRWYLAISILFFLIGAFAYETIWIVPLVIILITWFDAQSAVEKTKIFVRQAVIFWGFFLLYMISRRLVIGEIGGSPYGSSAIIKLDLLLWFRNYNIMVARSFLPPLQSNVLLIGLYFLLLILAFFFLRHLFRKNKLSKSFVFGIAGFLVSFLPVITLGVDSHDSESERFLYFPSVFAVWLLADFLFEALQSSVTRKLCFVILLGAEIFYLQKAGNVYLASSKIARVSMEAINQLKSTGELFCIDLPVQYKGGLIYRNGFAESVAWLATNNRAAIVEISSRTIIQPSLVYRVESLSLAQMSPGVAQSFLQRLPVGKAFTQRDVILKWTDSSLLVIK